MKLGRVSTRNAYVILVAKRLGKRPVRDGTVTLRRILGRYYEDR
jgi:hypothetical protein